MQTALTLRTWLNVQPSDAMPPYLSGGLPIIGHSREFGADPASFMLRGARAHGDLFTFNLMGTPAVGMLGPDANEAFFRAQDAVLSPKEAYKLMTPVFGKGIAYDADDQTFDEQIAFLYPALKESSLRSYVEHMAGEAERYFDKWGDQGEFDALDFGNELTMYTSSRSLLGAEFRSRLDSQFAKLYHDLDGSLTPIAFFFPYLPIPRFKKRDAARRELVKLFSELVEDRRRTGRKEDDLLQALIDARYKDGRALTHDEITGLVLTIVFAGHHTSGTLTAWTTIELLRNASHLGPIREELSALHPTRDSITHASLKKSTALEHFIMETERHHPPIVVMLRKALVDFSYKHWRIPAGTMLVTCPTASHQLHHVFSNPAAFDPARYEGDRAEHKKHPYSMITFGGGKHKCIGLNFAYLQIKAIFSVMLRRFDLSLVSPPSYYQPSYDMLLIGPKQPARIRYVRRSA